jgi:glucose-6-phosphate isomerase
MSLRVEVSGSAHHAAQTFVPDLVKEQVASRLFARDHTLWGAEAESESAVRLGWVFAASESIKLLPELMALRSELKAKGLTRLVLCGMGGSSLAPEVIAKTFGRELIVLDSTEPTQVRNVVHSDLASTVVVVSSKSGSTVETDSQKRSFEQAFRDAGIDAKERIFIVTDPNSPMHQQATVDGYRVFLADPFVGGRYSALTAFGVVPSMLAGVEMRSVLEDAIRATKALALDTGDNPGLVLGAALAKSASLSGLKDKIGIYANGTSIVGFGEWVEQLIAESTGKQGRGLLPVVLAPDSAELASRPSDLLIVELTSDSSRPSQEVSVSGSLGEQLILWEVATVVAAKLIGVNPFDQPDVESAKTAARTMLDSPATDGTFDFEEGPISVSSQGFDSDGRTLEGALEKFLSQVEADGYISIHCYLNRVTQKKAETIRNLIAGRTGRPTTFGWGPRFLHSTGQYHKGGPKQGLFLQLLSGSSDDQVIPGKSFGYRQLIHSQASGDARVLAEKGRPVLVMELKDPALGIQRLIELLS